MAPNVLLRQKRRREAQRVPDNVCTALLAGKKQRMVQRYKQLGLCSKDRGGLVAPHASDNPSAFRSSHMMK
jgi:hypothetical protein